MHTRHLAVILMAGLPMLVATGCSVAQDALYKSAIEKALHEDALIGKDPTAGHTAAMRQVDMSDCPQEFRVAYMNHIHAWDEAAAVGQAKTKLDNEEDGAAVGGILASLFGADATPWSDHVRAQEEVQRLAGVAAGDIKSTWQQIEVLAAKYGAQMP